MLRAQNFFLAACGAPVRCVTMDTELSPVALSAVEGAIMDRDAPTQHTKYEMSQKKALDPKTKNVMKAKKLLFPLQGRDIAALHVVWNEKRCITLTKQHRVHMCSLNFHFLF